MIFWKIILLFNNKETTKTKNGKNKINKKGKDRINKANKKGNYRLLFIFEEKKNYGKKNEEKMNAKNS